MKLLLILCLLLQCGAFLVSRDRHAFRRNQIFVLSGKKNALSAADALDLLKQAEALRSEVQVMEKAIKEAKVEKAIKETQRTDEWIDQLLVNITIDDSTQMLNTVDQVAQILQDKRLLADHVNKIFDRICETSLRRQSIENCSPMINLLLDAACKVDCLEREKNPNKRWNHRVERDLRKRLFAMGWGIDLGEVQSRNGFKSLSGEKDVS